MDRARRERRKRVDARRDRVSAAPVPIELSVPTPADLPAVLAALREWQDESRPTQLHPGDLGWAWRDGPEVLAAALRTWHRDGRLVAVGFLDGPDTLRLTTSPDAGPDLARQVAEDLGDPARGVLPPGPASVETPNGSPVRHALDEAGWAPGESWTPLRRDLRAAVPAPELRVEVVDRTTRSAFTALHRAAWGSGRFTDALWDAMAAGPAFADARCLLGRDPDGTPVAGATVWSAGPGRPGLVEPVGVHPDHRGRGHGRMISVAAAAALQELGSSSAEVCTPTSLVSAVATYRSAGYIELPHRLDHHRER